MKYNVDYFIKKFEAIPEEKWCIDDQNDDYGRHCAYGHCAHTSRQEENAFHDFDLEKSKNIFLTPTVCKKMQKTKLADINNGYYREYQQPTPKQRILAALYDIKANEAVKEAEEILSSGNSELIAVE